MNTGKREKFATKRRKFTKRGRKVRLSRGGQAGRESWRGKGGAPQRRGLPNGIPGGSQTRWGKAGAPERRGLPGVERRVSTSQAEAAPAVTVGWHDWDGGCYGRKMPLLMGDQAGRRDHCGKESSWRKIFLRNNREETRQATSAMGKASQTSSSTPVSEKRYATGMRMIS